VIVGLKLSDQVYRWLAYGPERARVRELRGELVDAGAQIVRTRQQSDSMRAVLRAEDEALEREVRTLRRYDDYARDGVLPADLYVRYRAELNRYNEHVSARHAKLEDWREVLDRNHSAVSRYTLLADRARDRLRQRAGGDWARVTLTGADERLAIDSAEQALAIDEALRKLEQVDERAARVVELIWFAGLTHEQAASTLGLNRRTIERDWRFARAYLKSELGD
jgi:RNA polymerase sigma factor (TIGR02999 family)